MVLLVVNTGPLCKPTICRTYERTISTRFSSDVESKPCLTLAVTGGGKFSPEAEAEAIQAKIQEEIDGGGRGSDNNRKTCVRLSTPSELAEGRDVFPKLFG